MRSGRVTVKVALIGRSIRGSRMRTAMDQELARELAHLAEAERHIAEGRKRVAEQRQRACSPGAATESSELLLTMQRTLVALEEHRELILSRVAELRR